MDMQLGHIEKENLGLSMEDARLQDTELGTLTVAQRTAPMAYPPSYSPYSSSSSSSSLYASSVVAHDMHLWR